MLTRSAAPHARETAAPLLGDADTERRWLSALYLGTIKDERALPVLWEMLAGPAPPGRALETRAERWLRSRLEGAHRHAITLVGAFGDPRATPALRGALQAALAHEQALVPPAAEAPDNERWGYEDALRLLEYERQAIVYALGRVGAFGAVLGLEGSEEQAELWRVQLALGSLHGRYSLAPILRFIQDAALTADVREVLAHQFGLGPAEQARHLARHEQEWMIALSSYYEALELLNAMRLGE